MYDVIYIGNVARVAEYIYYNSEFSLKGIICEEGRVSDELFTWGLIRDTHIFTINNPKDIEKYLDWFSNHIFICCSFVMRVPLEKHSECKVFNIHLSELPAYKGRHADYWAVMSGEKYMGISLHVMTEKYDDGDIIAIEKVPYYYWKNHKDINNEQIESVPVLLEKLVEYLNTGRIYCKNTDGGYYRSINGKDKTIDIEKDSPITIYNKVRSQSLYRGAKIIIGSDLFYIKDVTFTSREIGKDFIFEGNYVYIRYRDNIALRSGDYSYTFE